MPEKLLAAEVLIIRVFEPQLAHDIVAEIEGVFENRKPGHQPRRQRRPARAILIDCPKLLFEESPIDRVCKLHQRVFHVDDLVEP